MIVRLLGRLGVVATVWSVVPDVNKGVLQRLSILSIDGAKKVAIRCILRYPYYRGSICLYRDTSAVEGSQNCRESRILDTLFCVGFQYRALISCLIKSV